MKNSVNLFQICSVVQKEISFKRFLSRRYRALLFSGAKAFMQFRKIGHQEEHSYEVI